MTRLNCQSWSNKFVMSWFVHHILDIVAFPDQNCPFLNHMVRSHLMKLSLVVYLVKCHPVLYFTLVSLKTYWCKLYKEINASSVHKSVVFFCKIKRHFKMWKCNNRFNTILMTFIKQTVVELKSGFVRFIIITIRENPCPRYRSSERLESHFCKKSNILLIMMIKINSKMIWIVFTRNYTVSYPSWLFQDIIPCCHNISNGNTLPPFIPCSFKLMRCTRTAP